MLELALGEGRRRAQEAEQWRARAERAEHHQQKTQQLLLEFQKGTDMSDLGSQVGLQTKLGISQLVGVFWVAVLHICIHILFKYNFCRV